MENVLGLISGLTSTCLPCIMIILISWLEALIILESTGQYCSSHNQKTLLLKKCIHPAKAFASLDKQ